jgi:hypothetical protein
MSDILRRRRRGRLHGGKQTENTGEAEDETVKKLEKRERVWEVFLKGWLPLPMRRGV